MRKILNTSLRLFLGIISVIVTAFLLTLLFTKGFRISNLQVLRWFPLLICFIGFYFAGLINIKTKLVLTPFLLIALIVFIPIELFYFPLFYFMILVSILSIVVTRKQLSKKIKLLSLVTIIVLFGVFLFLQPLIIENEGYGKDNEYNLYNATVLWDFTPNEPTNLPNEIYKDSNGNDVRIINFEAKTLYITFWATWCRPCLGEKPELEKLKKLYQDRTDIAFIDISLDTDIERWKAYLAEHKPNGFQLVSQNVTKTRSNYCFSGIPHYIIVNSERNYKACQSPYLVNNELLSNQILLNEYIDTPYKVFKTIKTDGKDSIIRIR